ncbi:MAG: B12-binding domain-containing radical SAM protein [Anaerolineales bacterium]|nr:B12-binding domain-containing radical SAM protein [Anaerolineales bacterium]
MSGEVLLIACYELGHQPLSLAWPLAALQMHGVAATAVDLSVAQLPPETAKAAAFVGIAVPMHTALRLGVRAAQQIRYLNPHAHICFYGLYGWLNADYLLDGIADSVIAGEVETPLVTLVQTVLAGGDITAVSGISISTRRAAPYLSRQPFPVPLRDSLPPLTQYAHYVAEGETMPAGYVESTRGCLHFCTHCPVVPVYNGRFFAIPTATILADIRQQVASGARHITFGDPDFLNGPGHALRVAQALHREFPTLTFDFTTKVEHILKHPKLLAELRQLGASFVVSAFESTSNEVLQKLQKGHTVADLDQALHILTKAGLPVHPTLVAFTPWTTLNDYIELLTWIRERGLIPHIPTIQLAIRLLVPPGSTLLATSETKSWLGELDAANFTYRWQHPDPRMDELHEAVLSLAEAGHDDALALFAAVERLAYNLAGRPILDWLPPPLPTVAPPRLTENWYC